MREDRNQAWAAKGRGEDPIRGQTERNGNRTPLTCALSVRRGGVQSLRNVRLEHYLQQRSSPPGTGGVARSAGVVAHRQSSSIDHPSCAVGAASPPVPGGEPRVTT